MKTRKDRLPVITKRQFSCEIVGKRIESFQFSFNDSLPAQETPEFACNFKKVGEEPFGSSIKHNYLTVEGKKKKAKAIVAEPTTGCKSTQPPVDLQKRHKAMA